MIPARPIRWMLTLARLEGLSFLVLLGIAMPLKYAAGVDEATQWVGWTHGFLFLSFLVALASARRVGGWPFSWAGLGFVASLIPTGTFWFERFVLRRMQADAASS